MCYKKKHKLTSILFTVLVISPLTRAARGNHCGSLKLLLEKGADQMLKDHQGGGIAKLRAANNNCVSALEILLENQENLMCLDEDGQTLFHGHFAHGRPDVVLLLT